MSAVAANPEELMVAAAAKRLNDDEICFVGIGLPSLAAVLAKLTHAPGLTLLYESGVVDAIPPRPPLSTGDPAVISDTAYSGDCLAVFGALQAGHVDVGVLSAAQIDRHGNLNSTVIGDYSNPKVRLVGSGGAHDIATLASRLVIVMPDDPRRFVQRVDFVTSPGHPDGELRGELVGGGPAVVVTPRAIFTFEDGEMTLAAVQPGYSASDAVEGFPWQPPRVEDVMELTPPEPELLEILRHRVDPG